jgi:hypothetical protein
VTMQIIDTVTPQSFFYVENVPLEGASYGLGFYWNVRASAWFFDIDDPFGNPVVHGLRITAGRNLLVQSVNSLQPPGVFFVWDTSGGDVDPGINDLGVRVLLIYIPAADVAAIQAGTFSP